MNSSLSQVNLAPIASVMLVGGLLALAALLWLLMRSRGASLPQRTRALTLLTLFLCFDLVMFGAFTRLTDSGLGCPDWPGCYGHASPVGAVAQISAAQQAMPTGPVTHQKAWIEMVHRYLATGVGTLIVVLMGISWIGRQRLPLSPWWATFTLLWVCLQGAFGALTVTWKLFPLIVSLHLLGGMVLLALLQAQAARYATRPTPVNATTRSALRWAWLLLWLQMALGAWVSTNYAVLVCDGFPQCQGSWWPHMDFLHGFTLWRELGKLPDGSYLSVQALTAIHMGHRLMAVPALMALAWLGWSMVRQHRLRHLGQALLVLLALQLATGLSNVILDWPLLAAVAHTGGAAAMVLVLTRALSLTRAGQSWSLSRDYAGWQR